MSFNKLVAAMTAAAFLVGCATSSDKIAATSVSPMQYANFDCDQLAMESQRLTTRVQSLGGTLDQAAKNDAVLTGVAIVLFWPAAFALGGNKANEAEYGRLKGEVEALQVAAVQKKCPGMIVKATEASATVVTDSAEYTECIPMGYKAGDRLTIRGLGEVTVRRLSTANTQCGTNNSPPLQAVVMKVAPAATATPSAALVPPRQEDSQATGRLRQLNQMLRDGLITQQEFDQKKAEVLKSL